MDSITPALDGQFIRSRLYSFGRFILSSSISRSSSSRTDHLLTPQITDLLSVTYKCDQSFIDINQAIVWSTTSQIVSPSFHVIEVILKKGNYTLANSTICVKMFSSNQTPLLLWPMPASNRTNHFRLFQSLMASARVFKSSHPKLHLAIRWGIAKATSLGVDCMVVITDSLSSAKKALDPHITLVKVNPLPLYTFSDLSSTATAATK